MKAGLVVTTIRVPECLDSYLKNFEKYCHLHEVEIFVIPDEKTPKEAYGFCDVIDHYLWTSCPTLEIQEKFLQSVGLSPDFIARNSDERRNVGYLMAYAAGVDFIISIDDDNFCPIHHWDYFEVHKRALYGQKAFREVVEGEWYNSLQHLGVYQRGFPYFERMRRHTEGCGNLPCKVGDARYGDVYANQGLWFGDPDIDGMTWLQHGDLKLPVSCSVTDSYVLGPETWAPVNSQNTAIRAEALPAYYFIPLDFPVGAGWTGFGDIFQGYFLQACMKHMGHSLSIGKPLSDHRRNAHNYFRDAEKEWEPIKVLEELLPWLREECALSGKTYLEAYLSLSDQLAHWATKEQNLKSLKGWKSRLIDIEYFMQKWVGAFKTIGVREAVAE